MFTLSLHGEEGTQALLQSGYSYCLVVRSESQRSALLKNLGDQPGVVIVPHNGGLISNLRVWENIILPVQYHGIELAGSIEDNVAQLLGQCGLEDEAPPPNCCSNCPISCRYMKSAWSVSCAPC